MTGRPRSWRGHLLRAIPGPGCHGQRSQVHRDYGLSGDEVSAEQVERMCRRYYWAGARSIEAGDYSEPILQIARNHYGSRFTLRQFDAQQMPFGDASFDVVVIFEALYTSPMRGDS